MYNFISFKKSYEWGGKGKGKRVFEVQNIIHVRPFRKTKSCTAISLAWERAPQLGENSKEKTNWRAKPSGIVWGGKRVQAVHAIFYAVSLHFLPFFPSAEPGFRVRSAWKQFFCSQKILWNVDASSNKTLWERIFGRGCTKRMRSLLCV